ncbi:histone deacetylase complex subunit SAP18 [Blastocystis sp. ATCC 50177/Nand II]|uniref:Histone deacetylase complex subunit SAP18 n=1 Tax=Blastocystis sp. subtype 1 (strain ATCC 50177 / NandII) TaxID=478820 RepID=A0A196SC79_BLAHN|nr:histone deacetylase complex subunit SAP18 [Blastocystis sp. ATCC 50177/Nand II]
MQKQERVDRETTCPFLIRVFIRKNEDFKEREFSVKGDVPRNCEINIHTWKDATLKELCSLIKQVNEDARRRSAVLDFSSCFFVREGRYQFRHLGEVSASKPGRSDRVTLGSCRFQPGDHLCVVIRERDN